MKRYSYFFILKKKLETLGGYELDRSEIIYNFTKGKTTSLKDLSYHEYKALILFLENKLNKEQREKEQRMKRKLIAIMRTIGYEHNGKANMCKINAWVLKYGFLHKKLNAYNWQELPTLVSQAENFLNKQIHSLDYD